MTYWEYINNTKRTIIILVMTFYTAIGITQPSESAFNVIERSKTHLEIDKLQIRIDLFDGIRDEKIKLKNERESDLAKALYFSLIDDIQSLIENRQCADIEKYNDLVGLFNIVTKINEQNIQYTQYHHSILENAYALVANKSAGTLAQYLRKHPQTSLNNIVFYKDQPITEDFLLRMSDYYPAEILTEFYSFRREDYAMNVIEKIANVAPLHVKQYFNSKNNINTFLLKSENSTVRKILKLYGTYGHESKTYLFLDKITDTDSLDLYYHELGRDPNDLLLALISINSENKKPKAHFNIDQELEMLSLEFVREINDMHLMKDASERFAKVDSMTAAELYYLMVYSPEEIFTSTFNGFFDRFITKLDTIDGMEFLSSINMNRFRTFIKLCSGYNRLNQFFETMSAYSQDQLLATFVQNLYSESGSLKDAVDVADTFGSLTDSSQLNKFTDHMSKAYNATLNGEDRSAQILYGLLLNIINDRTQRVEVNQQMAALAQEIPDLGTIKISRLLDKDSINYQQHFFYDDEDGEYSFGTFVNTFHRNSLNWSIADSVDYIIISSRNGNNVQIYANKPLSERIGQQKIETLFERLEIDPTIVVHRGHSYYAKNTLDKISNNAQIVFLGSCGGYHNLTSVINKAASVHIISSKQIGTVKVNNPLLLKLSDNIRKGKDIDWQIFWKELEQSINYSAKGKEKFVDYIPPHKNLGVIFIKAYKSLME